MLLTGKKNKHSIEQTVYLKVISKSLTNQQMFLNEEICSCVTRFKGRGYQILPANIDI